MTRVYKLLLPGLAVAGAVLLLRAGTPEPEAAPHIVRTVAGVDGFELRHRDFDEAERPYFLPNFELGYAIWAGYPFVIYRDKVYERAGAGGVFIRPRADAQAHYLVEETVLQRNERTRNITSALRILDKRSGALLGERDLRAFRVENGHGWTGQHAAEFVRKVLVTDQPIAGAVGVKPYGQAPVTLEALPDAARMPAEHGGAGCPAGYAVKMQMPGRKVGLETGHWSFMPQSHANSVVCDGQYILVLSGYGDWLYLDLLSADGRHLFQTDLKTDVPISGRALPERLKVDAARVQVDLFYYERVNRDGEHTVVPRQRLRATFARASSGPGAANIAALAVK